MFFAPREGNAWKRLSGVQTKLHFPGGTWTMYFIIPLLEGKRESAPVALFLPPTPTVPLFLTPPSWLDKTAIAYTGI